jgi:hypothetical protein
LRRLAIALTVLAGGLAQASSIYPPEVRAHLSLSYTPACTLCHNNPGGGIGTVTTPFGKSMMSRGLVAQNIASLDTALDALSAERTDSDHDGVPDIDELKAQTDPNVAGGGAVTPPTYGCFDVSGQRGSPLALLPVALALVLWKLRRGDGRARSQGAAVPSADCKLR